MEYGGFILTVSLFGCLLGISIHHYMREFRHWKRLKRGLKK